MEATLAATVLHYLLLGLVFVTTLLLVLGAGAWLAGLNRPLRRRLAEVGASADAGLADAGAVGAFQMRLLTPLAKTLLPEQDWRSSPLRARLVRAGFREPQALPLYLAANSRSASACRCLAGSPTRP